MGSWELPVKIVSKLPVPSRVLRRFGSCRDVEATQFIQVDAGGNLRQRLVPRLLRPIQSLDLRQLGRLRHFRGDEHHSA